MIKAKAPDVEVETNENDWVAILTQEDPTIPEITVAPAPICPICGFALILQRPFIKEMFKREYWKCLTSTCKYTVQIRDDGEPDIKYKNTIAVTDVETIPMQRTLL